MRLSGLPVCSARAHSLTTHGHPRPGVGVHSVLVDKGVVFLTLTDRGYPKHLAFRYLGELATEFDLQNGTQVASASRPYAFVKFDTFIQRTRKLYLDARHGGGSATQRNVAQLAADLADVRDVVTRSVGEVLGAGERLDDVSAASAHLRAASATYARSARQLRVQAQWRQWAPALAVLGVIICVLFLRWLARQLFG